MVDKVENTGPETIFQFFEHFLRVATQNFESVGTRALKQRSLKFFLNARMTKFEISIFAKKSEGKKTEIRNSKGIFFEFFYHGKLQFGDADLKKNLLKRGIIAIIDGNPAMGAWAFRINHCI